METKSNKGGPRKGAGAKKLPYKVKLVRVPVELIPKVTEMKKAYKAKMKAKCKPLISKKL